MLDSSRPCAVAASGPSRFVRSAVLSLAVTALLSIAPHARAQNPPYYGTGVAPFPKNGDGTTAIAPQPWPTDAQWIPYSWGTTYPDPVGSNPVNDLRKADPSNGGTTPQNYVSVTSGCPDGSLPSIYFFYNPATGIIYFRWRVQQIANTYAIGPSPGAFSSTDPWHSALSSVFLSLTGTRYRHFA